MGDESDFDWQRTFNPGATTARARTADPDTSKRAAATVRLSDLEARALAGDGYETRLGIPAPRELGGEALDRAPAGVCMTTFETEVK